MNREQKAAAVEEIATQIGEAEAVFAVDYRGISVSEVADLRGSLHEAGASFRVVKNRLTLRAVEQADAEPLREHLSGPTALTFVSGDVALAAKAISTFIRQHQKLAFKGGIMDGEPLEPEQIAAIARLPGREQLNAQLAGVVASPLTGLVRGLGSLLGGLATQLGQIRDQGLVGDQQTQHDPEPAEQGGSEEDNSGSDD